MNKQIPTAIGILIILLFAGVVGVSVYFLGQEEVALLEEEGKHEEIEREGEIVKDLEICNNLQDLYVGSVTECYAEVAIREGDYLICERLADEDGLFAPGWIPNCFAFIAVEKGDKEICDLIDEVDFYSWPMHREQCYGFVEKGEVGSWIVE